MIRIITSPSDKIRLDYLVKSITPLENAALIVPEQFLFETERSMYKLIGPKGIARTEVTSFSKLSSFVIKKYGEVKLYADDIVKTVTMYKAISLIKSQFKYYKEGGNTLSYEFSRFMLDMVSGFKTAAITPDMLRETLSKFNAASPLTSKIFDISEIYLTYQKMLDDDFSDKLDDNRIAAELIDKNDPFKGREVFISEFDGFSQSQIGLIKSLALSAKNVTILLHSGFGDENSEMVITSLIKKLRQCLSPSGISFSKTGLGGEPFSPKIRLFAADNVYDECEFVAAKIHSLIFRNSNEQGNDGNKKKYNCDEIAVLMPRGNDNVAERLKGFMDEYSIKSFCDLPEPIILKNMTRFIISALDALDLDTPKLLSYVRSGFVRVSSMALGFFEKKLVLKKMHNAGERFAIQGDNAEDIIIKGSTKQLSRRGMDLIERAAYRFSLTKREWAKPFPRENKSLAGIEPLRREIVSPLIELRDACKDTTGDKITEALCEFLIEKINLSKTVLGLCYDNDGENTLLKTKNLSDEFRQLWELIIEVFESLHTVLKGFPISVSQYREILKGVFSVVEIAKPPQVIDAVSIGDLERSRLNNIKVVFIMGVNSGRFPKNVSLGSSVDSGFSSKEFEVLAEKGLELSQSLEERYTYERFMVGKALHKPSDRLYLSFPRTSLSFEELLPSPILEELSHINSIEIENISSLPLSFRARTKRSIKRIFAQEQDFNNKRILREVMSNNIDIESDIEDIIERFKGNDGKHRLEPDTALKIFGAYEGDGNTFNAVERFSPTGIETLMSCRFRYFCLYGIKIDTPIAENEEEPIALERGNIIHYCLEKAVRNIQNLDTLDDKKLYCFVEECIKEYRNLKIPYDFATTKRQQYILMSFKYGISNMIKHIKEDFLSSRFVPSEFEKKVEFPLGNEGISIKGKIDRVDRLGEHIRIIDYKTGNRVMDFPSIFYGLNAQMLLYLFSFKSRIPSAAFYLPSDGARVEGVVEPKGGVLTLDSFRRRENWLSSHIQSGIVINDDSDAFKSFVDDENRYRKESKQSARKTLIKAKQLLPNEYEKLERHLTKLISSKSKQLKRGEIPALPVLPEKNSGVCEYCEFSNACKKSRDIIINDSFMDRMLYSGETGEIKNEKKDLDK